MKTRRTYFLDYPCDMKPGEKVTFILALHGAGSYGNWNRNYFPVLDYKDKYRLVIATPNSPTTVWSEADDEYLHNIVDSVIGQIGKENVKAFWLVGHSQGGMTSNRIVRTDFFKDKVDGWLSLSGGRLGENPGRGNFGAIGGMPGGGRAGAPPAAGRGAGPGPAPATTGLPANEFSFIYETGQREMNEKGLPEISSWAAKLGCGARKPAGEIADAKAGYVYDGSRQNPPNPPWGLLPAPGKAQLFVYPDWPRRPHRRRRRAPRQGTHRRTRAGDHRELVKLIASAKGGKLQQAR